MLLPCRITYCCFTIYVSPHCHQYAELICISIDYAKIQYKYFRRIEILHRAPILCPHHFPIVILQIDWFPTICKADREFLGTEWTSTNENNNHFGVGNILFHHNISIWAQQGTLFVINVASHTFDASSDDTLSYSIPIFLDEKTDTCEGLVTMVSLSSLKRGRRWRFSDSANLTPHVQDQR